VIAEYNEDLMLALASPSDSSTLLVFL